MRLHHTSWVLVLATTVIAAVSIARSGQRPVDPEAFFDQIHLGDTAESVEARFMLPTGDYRMNRAVSYPQAYEGLVNEEFTSQLRELTWLFDTCAFCLLVNDEGVVVSKKLLRGSARQSPLEKWYDRVQSILPF